MTNRDAIIPVRGVVWATSLYALLIVFAAWIVMQQPWLGIKVSSQSDGTVSIDHVAQGGPASGRLHVGDKLIALRTSDRQLTLEKVDLLDSLGTLPTLAEYRRGLERQDIIAGMLAQGEVGLVLQSGITLNLQAQDGRPFSQIPPSFWIIQLVGMTAFMVTFITWSLRRGLPVTRIFLISGVALTFSAWSAAIYSNRELALDAQLFHILSMLDISGSKLLAFSLVALIWSYPRPLSSFPFVPIIYTLVAADFARASLMIADMPGHTFMIGLLPAVALGIAFSVVQWRRTAGRPDERAMLKWVNLSIYVVVFLIMGTYFLPVMLTGKAFVGIAFGYVIIVFVFLGFAFAITRYRLFDIERWWVEIWLWFFAGISIFAIDFILAALIKMNHGVALAVALIAVGWAYFPLRQWFWKKMFWQRETHLEDYLPRIVDVLTNTQNSGIEEAWKRLLQDIFDPVTFDLAESKIDRVQIMEDGAVLAFPCYADRGSLLLRHASKGRRLFLQKDVRLGKAVYQLVHGKQKSFASYLHGAYEERQRIVRDLHDDVVGRLVAVKLTDPDSRSAELTDEALKALRAVIHALGNLQEEQLRNAASSWYDEIFERCNPLAIELQWQIDQAAESLLLTSRQILNLERIIHEAVTNAIRHSSPDEIHLQIGLRGALLMLEIENNGNTNNDELQPGQGLLNMQTRMHELGGTMEYEDDRESGMFKIHCQMEV